MDNRYEFLCQSCPDPVVTFLTYNQLYKPRPHCPKCSTKFVPNLAYFRELPSFIQEDRTITPIKAEDMLTDVFTSSYEDVNPEMVTLYADRMKHNQWISAVLHMGGEYCPITLISGTVLLGVQRLLASIEAETSFTNTVVEVA